MKKDGLALVFITILLCAAAVADATGALTGPSGQGGTVEAPFAGGTEGTVEACFVDADSYGDLISEREKLDFDPSDVKFEGKLIPYDSRSNTLYIPQDYKDSDWKGVLSASAPFSRICILQEKDDEKKASIEAGRAFKMAVISGRKYMECSLVFTGLPAVTLSNGGKEPEPGKEYPGTICVLDPVREEYQEADCTFHLRGSSTTIFAKKKLQGGTQNDRFGIRQSLFSRAAQRRRLDPEFHVYGQITCQGKGML